MAKMTPFSWFDNQAKARRGFTMIEMLAVISIIALLSSVILASLQGAREQAKVARAVSLIQEVHKAVQLYYFDTKQLPPYDCMTGTTGPVLDPQPKGYTHECTAPDDPFINSMGIPGWNGPYLPIYNLTHPWSGHIGIEIGGDGNGIQARDASSNDGVIRSCPLPNTDCPNGIEDYFIFLDDDLIGMNGGGNGGQIPIEAMKKIDSILDDGNLATGNVRGNVVLNGPNKWRFQNVAYGEIAIFFEDAF